MTDTIYALSSGSPPAAIAVVRISGPAAGGTLRRLVGRNVPPRRALAATLQGDAGVLDRALVLWLPSPGTATGEDTAELHLHGGRAVVAAVLTELAAMPGLRAAQAGEFTRRAFANGRIDLAEAEGLGDLLTAETELQRRAALTMAGGALSEKVVAWRDQVLGLSAAIEAVLDFADEDDVATLPADFRTRISALRSDMATWLARPRADVLREGYRVVIAGPPNAGKSTLFNALVQDNAAIATPIAGTTRDVLTRPVGYEGVPFLFADTAGLHDKTDDQVEAIGIERALDALDRADLVLWLGQEGQGPPGSWEIAAQVDRHGTSLKADPRHRVSAVTGAGMEELVADLVVTARAAMPAPGEAALNERQHDLIGDGSVALRTAEQDADPLLVAESLRQCRVAFDQLLGRTTTEDMLDTLFGRFCIGK